jgi:hypothetical protein
MDQELQELRRELGALDRGPGRHYPEPLRRRATIWARRRVAEGVAVQAVAVQLVVHPKTLHKWLGATQPSTAAMVPVEVVVDRVSASGGVSLVSPSGFRVEGLTVDQAVTALRSLR